MIELLYSATVLAAFMVFFFLYWVFLIHLWFFLMDVATKILKGIFEGLKKIIFQFF